MTRGKLFIFPAAVIFLTSIQAIRLLFAQPSPYTFTGIDAVIPGLISFCVLLYFAFVLQEKYWQIGIILAGFAFITRKCITGYPDQMQIFVIVTLALNFIAAVSLSLSWSALGADFKLERQNQKKNSLLKKAIFVILLMTAIAGIFIFWGRG